jgi:alcohol dehydrogenase (cytochrome c)
MLTNRVRVAATMAAALFSLSAAMLGGQQGDAVGPPSKDFPVPGGNLGNQRYSTLKGITPTNIRRLGGAWMVHVLDGTPGNLEATPVVANGVMYVAVQVGGGVIALDAATGAVKWKRQASQNADRGVNRGVAVADGKVFTSGGDNTIIALDQKDGSLLWKANVAEHGSTLAAPIYHDGLVYIGLSGGEAGVRGFFGAFDAKTGTEVWGFWLVPGPGEPGHDTWEGDSWRHGGAPVWTHPAIDPALGVVYVATGNAWPDFDSTGLPPPARTMSSVFHVSLGS